MKKTLVYLLLLATLISLTGCHGANYLSSFEIPDTFDTSKEIEIEFWAKSDTNKYQTAVYNRAAEEFQTLYPNVKVSIKIFTDYGKIYQQAITNLKTGTTPNVCITYPDHIATYMESKNSIVPLDDLMTHPKYGLGGSMVPFDAPKANEIAPQFLSECNLLGHYYALPYMRSTEAMYINKTMVEKLGYTLPEKLTWDFVWEVSEAATKTDENGVYLANGQTTLIPFIYKSTDNMMIQMLKQLNAPYSRSDGSVLIENDTTKSILKEIASHTRKENTAFSTFGVVSYPADMLNAGQCIFAVDSTAGATWMGSDAPLLDIAKELVQDFEIEVMPIPQFDTENPKMISQGPSVCIFNKEDPQEVLASWLFVQYLLTDDIQISYATTEGYVPVTLKAQNTERYQTYLANCGIDNDEHYEVKIKASKLLLDNLDNTFVTPVFNGSANLRNVAGELIERVVRNQISAKPKALDDAYMADLFLKLFKSKKLDQIEVNRQSSDLISSPLPTQSVLLLSAIALVWLCMGISVVIRYVKGRIENKRKQM